MKNEFGNAIGEVKQSQLAIVKRIDEFPTWRKPVENVEIKVERSFEPLKKKNAQPKKSKKKQGKNAFKNWNLPLQPEGYLKPRINDLL
jgi:hypothetical protein